MLAAAAVLAASMLAGLQWAKSYATRDWSAQVSSARERSRNAAPPPPVTPPCRAVRPRPSARAWAFPSCVRRSGDAMAWLAVARGAQLDTPARVRGFLLGQSAGAPPEVVLNELGALELRSGRPVRALPFFESALASRPGFSPALCNRALCEARLGRSARALADAAAYAARHPADAGALRLLAALLCEADRHPEALALLERALARGGSPALALDAAELAARGDSPRTALLHLAAAMEGGVPLARVAQTYKGPLFDALRASPDGRAFTAALADRVRNRPEASP